MKIEKAKGYTETPKLDVFPCLIVMAGLPGTGKSTLARALAKELDAVVLDKDVIREALFSHEKVNYSTQQNDLVIVHMLERAEQIMGTGKTVILDGRPFSHRHQVESVHKSAEKMGVPFKMILCTCPGEIVLERIASSAGRHLAKNRNAELYQRLKREFEPIEEEHLEVDTSQPLRVCLECCLQWL